MDSQEFLYSTTPVAIGRRFSHILVIPVQTLKRSQAKTSVEVSAGPFANQVEAGKCFDR